MIPFHLRAFASTGRWVAPLLLLLVWVALVLGGESPEPSPFQHVEYASVCFLAFVTFGLWVTVQIGSLDDDPGRDLLAAAAGSAGRLHLLRVATGLAIATVAAVITGLVVFMSAGDRTPQWLLIVVGVLVMGALLGVGAGAWLMKPILRHRAAVVLLAVLSIIICSRIPPITDGLRTLSEGDRSPLLWMAPVVPIATVLLVAGSTVLVGRRAR